MKVPSLRRGCEIAPFLFATWTSTVRFESCSICEYIQCDALFTKQISHIDRRIDSVSVGDVRYRSCDFYAPQTKILEGGTKDEIRIFD
jgi:hypothetical protein